MTKHEFVRQNLRKAWLKWPDRGVALKNAFIEKRVNPTTGRLAGFYECTHCKGAFMAKDIQIDHINPVAQGKKDYTWDDYINRLLCPAEDLQALCVQCHKKKTKEESKNEGCA